MDANSETNESKELITNNKVRYSMDEPSNSSIYKTNFKDSRNNGNIFVGFKPKITGKSHLKISPLLFAEGKLSKGDTDIKLVIPSFVHNSKKIPKTSEELYLADHEKQLEPLNAIHPKDIEANDDVSEESSGIADRIIREKVAIKFTTKKQTAIETDSYASDGSTKQSQDGETLTRESEVNTKDKPSYSFKYETADDIVDKYCDSKRSNPNLKKPSKNGSYEDITNQTLIEDSTKNLKQTKHEFEYKKNNSKPDLMVTGLGSFQSPEKSFVKELDLSKTFDFEHSEQLNGEDEKKSIRLSGKISIHSDKGSVENECVRESPDGISSTQIFNAKSNIDMETPSDLAMKNKISTPKLRRTQDNEVDKKTDKRAKKSASQSPEKKKPMSEFSASIKHTTTISKSKTYDYETETNTIENQRFLTSSKSSDQKRIIENTKVIRRNVTQTNIRLTHNMKSKSYSDLNKHASYKEIMSSPSRSKAKSPTDTPRAVTPRSRSSLNKSKRNRKESVSTDSIKLSESTEGDSSLPSKKSSIQSQNSRDKISVQTKNNTKTEAEKAISKDSTEKNTDKENENSSINVNMVLDNKSEPKVSKMEEKKSEEVQFEEAYEKESKKQFEAIKCFDSSLKTYRPKDLDIDPSFQYGKWIKPDCDNSGYPSSFLCHFDSCIPSDRCKSKFLCKTFLILFMLSYASVQCGVTFNPVLEIMKEVVYKFQKKRLSTIHGVSDFTSFCEYFRRLLGHN